MKDKKNSSSTFRDRIVELLSKMDNFYKKNEPILSFISKLSDSIVLTYFLAIIWVVDVEIKTTTVSILIYSIRFLITIWLINLIWNTWRKQNEVSRFLRSIVLLTMALVILSFPLSYIILSLGRSLSTQPGARIGTADGWLSFTGSILGGSITMIAVVLTIRHENDKSEKERKTRLEEAEYQNPPTLKVSTNLLKFKLLNKSSSKFTYIMDQYRQVSEDDIEFKLNLVMNNSSKISITNVSIVDAVLSQFSSNLYHITDNKDLSLLSICKMSSLELGVVDNEIILPDNFAHVNISFKVPYKYLSNSADEIDNDLVARLQINYSSTLTSRIFVLTTDIYLHIYCYSRNKLEDNTEVETFQIVIDEIVNRHKIK